MAWVPCYWKLLSDLTALTARAGLQPEKQLWTQLTNSWQTIGKGHHLGNCVEINHQGQNSQSQFPKNFLWRLHFEFAMANYIQLVLSAVSMGAIHQLKQGTVFSFRHLSCNMNLYISNTIIIMNLDSCLLPQTENWQTEIRELQISKVKSKFNLKGSVSHTYTSLLAVKV